ncbi:MAG: mismatch repair protein MutT [Bacillales bacterium]|jgi:8-oxo-dGTP diphosphatase|nr:mismatch repair protein MutT [Bacillales bacterium]
MLEKTFGHAIKDVDYIERPGAYGVMINEQKQVVVAFCDGDYFLPGGGIEGNESHQECIKRECLEELALQVNVKNFIYKGDLYHTSIKSGKHYHSIGYFYMTEIVRILDQPSEEDHELVWMDVEEAVGKLTLESQAWAVSEACTILEG